MRIDHATSHPPPIRGVPRFTRIRCAILLATSFTPQSTNCVHTNINPIPRQRPFTREYPLRVLPPSSPQEAALAELKAKPFTTSVQVLDDAPDTDNPMWFPRRIEELDFFATRVKNLGKEGELSSDHPGATDAVYLERRHVTSHLVPITSQSRHPCSYLTLVSGTRPASQYAPFLQCAFWAEYRVRSLPNRSTTTAGERGGFCSLA
jgi:hypothetical protein